MTDIHFAVHSIGYLPYSNAVSIRCHTFTPCHLTAAYTAITPRKHPLSRTLRGLTMPWGTYFCFVAFKLVEQSELGDTLIHTFYIPEWEYCQTRWFFFKGEVGGLTSPSYTCIFQYHHPGVPPYSTEEQTTGVHWSSILDWNSWGQRLPITNRLLFELSFYLKRFANPAGDIWYRIISWGAGPTFWSKKLCAASDIALIPQWYPLAIDPPIFINEEVGIETMATASGSTGNTSIYASLLDVKPNEHLYFRRFDGVITQHPTKDYMYRYLYTGYQY